MFEVECVDDKFEILVTILQQLFNERAPRPISFAKILIVKFQKSWLLKFQAGSLQPSVLIAWKWHVTRLIWQVQVIAHTIKPSMSVEKKTFSIVISGL